ncbi:MAG: NAD(P)/FAD-dependent oxidoreductase [Alphaproteobacteria bacterium]|nr:NAD(P)/FAD-dependent oxidoreductase [Alphaproteobacteria bacterium]
MARVVVIGGGHNGLAAAVRLARAKHQVTVLEARPTPGGSAAGAEFHPGYRHTGIFHDASTFSDVVARDLGLRITRRPLPDAVIATAEVARTVGATADLPDPAGWAAYRKRLDEVRKYASTVLSEPPPRTDADAPLLPLAKTAWGLRRLGQATMMELLRIGPMAVEDWLAEMIADPITRAGLALEGLHGTWMGPRSPTSTATLLLLESLRGQDVQGGPAAVVDALVDALKTAGGTLRCEARVARVLTKAGRVTGVETASGDRIDADHVVAACDPRHALLDLVDPLELPPALERDMSDVRARGLCAKVHLALSGPLELAAKPGVHERILVAGQPNDLERAFDQVKYRRFADRLPLDIRVPTASDSALAPAGHHVVSILVHAVPFVLDEGWSDATREKLGNAVLASLEAVAPGVSGRVVASEVLTPADLADRFGLPQGHLWHGELAIDQLFVARPFLGTAQYATAIGGLWLASAGTHPGGGFTGLSGWNAAGRL